MQWIRLPGGLPSLGEPGPAPLEKGRLLPIHQIMGLYRDGVKLDFLRSYGRIFQTNIRHFQQAPALGVICNRGAIPPKRLRIKHVLTPKNKTLGLECQF